MKVVSFAQGVVVRKFAMEELLPVVGAPYNTITQAVQERYNFQAQGLSTEAQQQGLVAPVFERGEFLVNGDLHSIFGLELGPDGLKATAYKTEVIDAFLEDLFSILRDDFDYRVSILKKPPLYSSSILIDLDEGDLKIFSFLQRSAKLMEEELKLQNKERPVTPFGIRLIARNDPYAPVLYVLEKRLGSESNSNVYLSQAPLPSESHERFLNSLFQASE